MSGVTDFAQKWIERNQEEERLRSQAEEQSAKALDPLIAHTKGDQGPWSGLRKWWLWFWTMGVTDPPNSGMERIGEFQVMTIEWEMSGGVASADVFHDPDRERNRKMLYDGGSGPDLGGLDNI